MDHFCGLFIALGIMMLGLCAIKLAYFFSNRRIKKHDSISKASRNNQELMKK